MKITIENIKIEDRSNELLNIDKFSININTQVVLAVYELVKDRNTIKELKNQQKEE